MKKIQTVFQRDPGNMARVLPVVAQGCEWVLAGEGVATAKYDGVCTMFDGTRWWARREVKPGKAAPANWVEVDADPVTSKRVGWEPIEQSSFVKIFPAVNAPVMPGTYEFVGPKVNGNPYRFNYHYLLRHGEDILTDVPRDFDGLRDYLLDDAKVGFMSTTIEGIVWWRDPGNPDAGRAKLKVRDFR